MLYALIVLAGITGYFALRTNFPLFRFGAAIPWIALMAYIVGNYSGENWTVIAILGCIVMMCAFPLMQLGKDVKRSRNMSEGFNQESLSWKFKWNDKEEKAPTKAQQKEDTLAEYRDSMRGAFRGGSSGRRRR